MDSRPRGRRYQQCQDDDDELQGETRAAEFVDAVGPDEEGRPQHTRVTSTGSRLARLLSAGVGPRQLRSPSRGPPSRGTLPGSTSRPDGDGGHSRGASSASVGGDDVSADGEPPPAAAGHLHERSASSNPFDDEVTWQMYAVSASAPPSGSGSSPPAPSERERGGSPGQASAAGAAGDAVDHVGAFGFELSSAGGGIGASHSGAPAPAAAVPGADVTPTTGVGAAPVAAPAVTAHDLALPPEVVAALTAAAGSSSSSGGGTGLTIRVKVSSSGALPAPAAAASTAASVGGAATAAPALAPAAPPTLAPAPAAPALASGLPPRPKSQRLAEILSRARAAVASRNAPTAGGGAGSYSCMSASGAVEPDIADAPPPRTARSDSVGHGPHTARSDGGGSVSGGSTPAAAGAAPSGGAAQPSNRPPSQRSQASVLAAAVDAGNASTGAHVEEPAPQPVNPRQPSPPPAVSAAGAPAAGTVSFRARLELASATAAHTARHACELAGLCRAPLAPYALGEYEPGWRGSAPLSVEEAASVAAVESGLVRVRTRYVRRDVRELAAGLLLVQRLRNVPHRAAAAAAVGGAGVSSSGGGDGRAGTRRGRSLGPRPTAAASGRPHRDGGHSSTGTLRGTLHRRSSITGDTVGTARLPPLSPSPLPLRPAATSAGVGPSSARPGSVGGGSMPPTPRGPTPPPPPSTLAAGDRGAVERTPSSRSVDSQASSVAGGDRTARSAVTATPTTTVPSSARRAAASAPLPPTISAPLLPPRPSPVWVMRFSPNGKYLAVAGGATDGGAGSFAVRVWRTWSWERHMAEAKEAATAAAAAAPSAAAAAAPSSAPGSQRSAATASTAGLPSVATSVTAQPPSAQEGDAAATLPADVAVDGELPTVGGGAAAMPARKGSAASTLSRASEASADSARSSSAHSASPSPSDGGAAVAAGADATAAAADGGGDGAASSGLKPPSQPPQPTPHAHMKRLSVEYLQAQSDAVVAGGAAARAQPSQSSQQPAPAHSTDSFPFLEPRPVREWAGHTAPVVDAAWSPSSTLLLTASVDCSVRLWHVGRAACLHRFVHSDVVAAVAFHPLSDAAFVTGGFDRRLRLWSTDTRRVVTWQSTAAVVTSLGYTPDGSLVAAGLFNGTVTLHASDSLRYFTTVEVAKRSAAALRGGSGRGDAGSSGGGGAGDAATSSVGGRGPKVTGIDFARLPAALVKHASAHGQGRPWAPPPAAGGGTSGPLVTVMLVSASDSSVRSFRLDDFSMLFRYAGHAARAMQVRACFDPSGLRVVAGGDRDRTVTVWRTLADRWTPAVNPRFTGLVPRRTVTSRETFTAGDGERRRRGRRGGAAGVLVKLYVAVLRACHASGRLRRRGEPVPSAAAPPGADAAAVTPAATAAAAAPSSASDDGGSVTTDSDHRGGGPLDSGADNSDAASVRSYESGGWSEAGDSVLTAGTSGSAAVSSAARAALARERQRELGGDGGGDTTAAPQQQPPLPSPAANAGAAGAVVPALRLGSLRASPPAVGPAPPGGGAGADGAAPPLPLPPPPPPPAAAFVTASEIPEGEEDDGDDDDEDDDSDEDRDTGGGVAGCESGAAPGGAAATPQRAQPAAPAAAHDMHPASTGTGAVSLAVPGAAATGADKGVDVTRHTLPHASTTQPAPLEGAAPAQQPPTSATTAPPPTPAAPAAAAAAPAADPGALDDADARADLSELLGRRQVVTPVAIFAPEAALAIARPLRAAHVWARRPRGSVPRLLPSAQPPGDADAAALADQHQQQLRACVANQVVMLTADTAGVLRVYENVAPAAVV